MTGKAIGLCLLVGITSCKGSCLGEGTPLRCDPSAGRCELTHDFAPVRVEPGEHIGELCQSWSLNNPQELWVNQVDLKAGGGYHHSNWFFVPNTVFDRPDGAWPCAAEKFEELSAAVQGGVLFAQSTQATTETQKFSEGVAVRIPPWSRVIGNTHLMNMSKEPLSTDLRLTITTIPPESVKTKLTPFRFTYWDLHLPPRAASLFAGACNFRAASEPVAGAPFSYKIHYVLPHYHELGRYFELSVLGGPSSGEVIYDLLGFTGKANGKTYNPPIDISQADGLQFVCGYQNASDNEVGWGLSEEMCVMFGFAESAVAFDAEVPKGSGGVVAVQDGLVINEGPCKVTALPWSQDKQGGVPPAK